MSSENKSKKNPIRKMAIFIASILLIFGAAILLYSAVLSSVKNAKQSAMDQAKDTKFDLIWTQLQLSLEQSYANAEIVAEHIERDIKTEFDLTDLKDALDTNDADAYQRLSKLVAKNIERISLNDIDNHRNSVIVMTGDGIILEDYTIDLSTKIPAGDNFNKYLDTSYNKELFLDALRKLKIHSEYIIAIENIDYIKNDDHIKVSDVNRDTLKQVYDAEGLAGLQNYEFMTPVYITDTGDIFGTKDIIGGIPQENHKFIVIQTFNLYDQIIRNDHEYADNDYECAITERYDDVLVMLYIFGIILVVAIAACILYMMALYNFITDRYEDHDSITT